MLNVEVDDGPLEYGVKTTSFPQVSEEMLHSLALGMESTEHKLSSQRKTSNTLANRLKVISSLTATSLVFISFCFVRLA